ncbi:MAG: hypothetical protein HRT69_08500 [Flavobacteriaceae bacterium]|nr:hypothetical protein [Flavobacteriaceae bacterium]
MLLQKIKTKIKSFITNSYSNKGNKELLTLFSHFSDCIILGSSPSINELELTNLSKNTMVITMGNFYEHPAINAIKPSIHVFAASHPPITEKVLVNWWSRCNEVLPLGTPVLVEKRDKEIATRVFAERKVFTYSYGGDFPIDFTKPIISPWSVTIVGLQLAIYVKVPEIYLMGINHDWQCIKPYLHFYNHNAPSLEYYLKNEGVEISYEKQQQPFPKERLYREYELYQQYETLKLYAEKRHQKIYNGDENSDFDVFKHVNYTI